MKRTSIKANRKDRPARFDAMWTGTVTFKLRSSVLSVLTAAFFCLAYFGTAGSYAQTSPSRNGAHSVSTREAFTPADRRLVERAIGQTCAERIRDPFGSMPIDEMQARPSLAVGHPDAVAGLRRAERVLPATRKLVAGAILQLAKEYNL